MSNNEHIEIHVSDEARKYLLDFITKPYLRIDVIKGGCSGLSYKIEEVDHSTPDDLHITLNEKIAILVNKEIGRDYLNGLKVNLTSSGFGQMLHLENPNAKHSCGCNESFSV
ncbi:iron-sulfur cluster assembly accessory protein [bacterium]|nr:iron-sulfur cluster assembly accessory protein [bacterium]NBW56893.1 iron-sulfur cluster assembly accessory protein [bacterium]NBX72271.1 iron-sulfur cluster assembly accessory protein [bacterium]